MCKPYPKEPPEQHAADLRARIMNPAYEIPEMLSMKTCAEKTRRSTSENWQRNRNCNWKPYESKMV